MNIENPHDKLFKELQSNKENAIDFMQGTFPVDLVSKLNFASLKLDKNSYINEDLKESFADVVYDCDYKGKKKTKVKISLLFEHKSRAEKYPHLQLLKYMQGIWEYNLKNKKSLPVIIPVVFYHGKEKWHYRDFDKYFKTVDDGLLNFIPRFDYLLTDLANYDEEKIANEIFKRDSLKIAMLIMKNASNSRHLDKHLFDFMKIGADYFSTKDGELFVEAITHYILSIMSIDTDDYVNKLEKISEEGGEIAMTTAVRLRQEGRKEGRKEGRQEGIQEGKIEDAQKLKNLGVNLDIIAKATGISKEQIEKL